MIDIGSNVTFTAGYFGPSTGNTIHFLGQGNTFILTASSLDGSGKFDPIVYGFNSSDVIDFNGATITGASVTSESPTLSMLNLLNGAQIVAKIELSGNYSALNFVVTPTASGQQINIATSGPSAFGQSWTLVGAGTYNNDVFGNLTWQQQSGGLVELQFLFDTSNLGGGVIQNSPFTLGWTVAATGDFNGDHQEDLVYRRSSDGVTEIQFLNGTTPIGGGVIANNPFDASWNIVGTGDFNGDGNTDLIWQQPSSGLVEIQLINGGVAVGGGLIQNNPFGAGWSIVATGDFNGDGKSDLVWRNQSTSLVEIQFLDRSQAIGGGAIANNAFGAGWNVVGAGDFLGNGANDLVFQRQSDSLVEIQFLTGITATGGGVILNNPFGPGWQVVGHGRPRLSQRHHRHDGGAIPQRTYPDRRWRCGECGFRRQFIRRHVQRGRVAARHSRHRNATRAGHGDIRHRRCDQHRG